MWTHQSRFFDVREAMSSESQLLSSTYERSDKPFVGDHLPAQVYLKCARNATVFRHFLAHFPEIVANELRT
jgi:hypothetical protein